VFWGSTYFFACAKKYQKSTPENENSPFSGQEVGLSGGATVASEEEFYCALLVQND